MQNSWIVLLPPILVIFVAIIRRNVIISLLTGIISAALIASDFHILKSINLIFCRLVEETDITTWLYTNKSPDHLYTFAFLIILGIIISLITHTGGITAYSAALAHRLKNKKTVQSMSLLLSLGFFIDDYLNSFTVGSIMRPLTDRFKIPRAKLAFLIDTMSSPLCVIIPASSWVASILTQLEASGVSSQAVSCTTIIGDPFNIYISSMIYMFYPILVMISSWVIVRKNISFGSMYTQEKEAEETGNLFGGKKPLELKITESTTPGSTIDFILPIGTFIISIFLCLLYSGNWWVFGGDHNLFKALANTNIFSSLFYASILALIISIITFTIQGKFTSNNLKNITISGFDLMKSSLLVLLLAWTFSSLLKNDLETGKYFATLLLSALPAFLVPLMIFTTSAIVVAVTGSAWGTISVMMPLAIPIIVTFSGSASPITISQAYLLYPVIGALISGSIAGGHISTISDSTVVSATSSGCYHLDHFITQLSYVIPVIIGTIIALIIIGLFASYSPIIVVPAAFASGLLADLAILFIRNKNK